MARRKKPTTPEEKIQFYQDLIVQKEEELSDLQKQLAEAEEEKQNRDMAQLYLEIQKQGLSIEDAMAKIKN